MFSHTAKYVDPTTHRLVMEFTGHFYYYNSGTMSNYYVDIHIKFYTFFRTSGHSKVVHAYNT